MLFRCVWAQRLGFYLRGEDSGLEIKQRSPRKKRLCAHGFPAVYDEVTRSFGASDEGVRCRAVEAVADAEQVAFGLVNGGDHATGVGAFQSA